jgi:hypothetical protein
MSLPESSENKCMDMELLDRWVDGEVDAETASRLLAQCESSPGIYRHVALAFLERQQLRECLLAECSKSSVKAEGTRLVAKPSGRSGASRSLQFPAAIACGLLGVVVGMGATLSIRRSSDPALVSREPMRIDRQRANPGSDRNRENEDGGDMLIAQQTRDALRQAGVDWEESPHVYLVHGNDGTRWAVPTHEVVFRYDRP